LAPKNKKIDEINQGAKTMSRLHKFLLSAAMLIAALPGLSHAGATFAGGSGSSGISAGSIIAGNNVTVTNNADGTVTIASSSGSVTLSSGTALPLPAGATNYDQNVATGTSYDHSKSTDTLAQGNFGSATISGPNASLSITNPANPGLSLSGPMLGDAALGRKIDLNSTIDSKANTVAFNAYSLLIQTGTADNTANAAHGGGGVFRATDTAPGRTDLFGVEGRVDARSTSTVEHTAVLGMVEAMVGNFTNAQSSSAATYTGLRSRVQVYTDDTKAVAASTGNVRGVWVEPLVGGNRTLGNAHAIYQEGTTDYDYFGGIVGIGTTLPVARLQVTDSLGNAVQDLLVQDTAAGANAEILGASGVNDASLKFNLGSTANTTAGLDVRYGSTGNGNRAVLRLNGGDVIFISQQGWMVFMGSAAFQAPVQSTCPFSLAGFFTSSTGTAITSGTATNFTVKYATIGALSFSDPNLQNCNTIDTVNGIMVCGTDASGGASGLPLPEGGTNYMLRVATGTSYDLSKSTLANISSGTASNFTAARSTATTLSVSNLVNCNTIDSDANGTLFCGVDASGSSGLPLAGGGTNYMLYTATGSKVVRPEDAAVSGSTPALNQTIISNGNGLWNVFDVAPSSSLFLYGTTFYTNFTGTGPQLRISQNGALLFEVSQTSITLDTHTVVVPGATLSFQTTYYISLGSPYIVGVASMAVAYATSPLNGLAVYDGNLSTASGNWGIYHVAIPDNYVAGSTPTLKPLQSMTTGLVNAQESYVVLIGSEASNGLAVNLSGGGFGIALTTCGVTSIGGVTSASGGVRTSTAAVLPLNGFSALAAGGNKTVDVIIVRDGASALNDPSTSSSALLMGFVAVKFQQ
jgi:hypothetical protein